MKSITEANIAGKRVIVRVDFNVPIINGKIQDDSRIKFALPTIKYLLKNNNQVILISHLGQPKEKEESFSLKKLLAVLEQFLATNIAFAYSEQFEALTSQIILLENLRFNSGESQNNLEYAKLVASWGEIYVNEAFSCCHRQHASIVTLPRLLPAFAGIGLMKEVQVLSSIFTESNKPITVIIGGAKISTKLPLLQSLLKKVDKVAIAGAMANNLLKEKNLDIGTSLYESNIVTGLSNNPNIVLPQDVVTAEQLSSPDFHICDIRDLPPLEKILDIGPATIIQLKGILRNSKAVIWNGPLGAFEHPLFNRGTEEIAKEIAMLTKAGRLISIVGGGDTLSALQKYKEGFSHISTGGGAFLQLLEKSTLPGIEALYQEF